MFSPILDYTKEGLAQSACCELALAIHLINRQDHHVLPRNQLGTRPFAPADPSKTILGTGMLATDLDRRLTGPWGSPYKIKVLSGEVSVSSVHTSYVATEQLDSNVD